MAAASPPEPCWGAGGGNTRSRMRERPEHLPQFRGLCFQGWTPAKICSGRCSGCSALTFLLGELMLHFGGAEEHRRIPPAPWAAPTPSSPHGLGGLINGDGAVFWEGRAYLTSGRYPSNSGITQMGLRWGNHKKIRTS